MIPLKLQLMLIMSSMEQKIISWNYSCLIGRLTMIRQVMLIEVVYDNTKYK